MEHPPQKSRLSFRPTLSPPTRPSCHARRKREKAWTQRQRWPMFNPQKSPLIPLPVRPQNFGLALRSAVYDLRLLDDFFLPSRLEFERLAIFTASGQGWEERSKDSGRGSQIPIGEKFALN